MSTYVPIQTISLTSNVASIEFTGVPSTYTDLVIAGNIASSDSSLFRGLRLRLNSETGSVYSTTYMYGESSTAFSVRESNQTSIGCSEIPPGTSWSAVTIQIQNYANSITNKTVLSKGGTPTIIHATVGTWRSSSAVTSVQLFPTGGASFRSGTNVTLYGVGVSPKAFGGSIVRTDGAYWYHIFDASGSFIANEDLSNVEYLVIAGGGGGGGGRGSQGLGGAGGGAGGYRCSVPGETSGRGSSAESRLNLTKGTYTVTVGAGGAGGAALTNGTNGNNSVFGSITSLGGGGGANGSPGSAGGNGGAGGGAGYESGIAGTGTTGQGYNGGPNGGGLNGSGGGGGAGGAGQQAQPSYSGGAGGAGLTSSITGSAVSRGGGGGAGGASDISGAAGSASAGGGAGASSAGSNGTAGTSNTGGGGGGGARTNPNASAGGSGGSGIVIVRYAV